MCRDEVRDVGLKSVEVYVCTFNKVMFVTIVVSFLILNNVKSCFCDFGGEGLNMKTE